MPSAIRWPDGVKKDSKPKEERLKPVSELARRKLRRFISSFFDL
jgi:hypothetical protein